MSLKNLPILSTSVYQPKITWLYELLLIYGSSILNLAYSILSIRLLASTFGPELLTSWFLLFSITQYIVSSTSSIGSVIHAKSNILSEYVASSLMISCCVSLAAYILCIVVATQLLNLSLLYISCIGFIYFGKAISVVVQAFFLTSGRIIFSKNIDLIFSLSLFIPLLYLAQGGESIDIFFMLHLFSAVAVIMSNVLIGIRYLDLRILYTRLPFTNWYNHIGKDALALIPSVFGSVLIWNTDNFILLFSGLESEVNEYNVLARIFLMLSSICTLLSPIFLRGLKDGKGKVTNYIGIAVLTHCILSGLVLLNIDTLVSVILDADKTIEISFAMMFALYTTLFITNCILSVRLSVLGRFKFISIVTFIEAITNLSVSVLLATSYGAFGVITGSVVGASLSMGVMVCAKRY